MRALVIGGAGFVGSNLVRSLVRGGHEVVVADNLATARSLELLGPPRDYEFCHLDVRCPEDFRRLPGGGWDRVYHLAASYANALSVEQPLLDMRTNVEGTLHALEFARGAGCGLFVYTGSSSSYGDAPVPFEEDGPMRPQTPYALHKQVGEWHVRASRVPYAIFRLFNVFGPGDPPGRYRNVVPNMMVAAAAGSDARLRVFGEGATRDFSYVDDVVAVLADPERAAGRTLNVGTGVETPIVELARRIARIFELPEERIVREPPRGWDGIARRAASVARLRELYGDRQMTPLDDGLRRTARWLGETGRLRAGIA